jgi:hypothetical protein
MGTDFDSSLSQTLICPLRIGLGAPKRMNYCATRFSDIFFHYCAGGADSDTLESVCGKSPNLSLLGADSAPTVRPPIYSILWISEMG